MGDFIRILVISVLSVGFGGPRGGAVAAFSNPRSYNGTTITRVQSERGSALVLPLTGSPRRADRIVDRRRLGEDARMTLHDDLLSKGYYTSRVFIGTPPQEFALIVDTGSTVTYVPCSSCTHCGHHQDPRFQPENSSSYAAVGCRSPDCHSGTCELRSHQCKYERMYAEHSSSKGVLGKDLLGFGLASRLLPQPLVFGCETAETGDLYLQHADGILGLGRGPLSIVDQLVKRGAMEEAFSLCYGGMADGGGAMVLGAIPAPAGMVFVKSDPRRSNYYNLGLSEIQVQGVRLDLDSSIFDRKFGTVLDSGTTYAYLPDRAFTAFRDAVVQQLGSLQVVDGPDPNYPDICYAGAGRNVNELSKHFPTVDFVFAENKKVSLAPENYLFKHTKVEGAYCLGFFKGQDATTLLGGIVVRNMLVTYDRSNHQIGFLKTDCQNLWSLLPPESPLGSPSESPPASTQSPAPTSDDEQEFGSLELVIALAVNLTTFSSETPLFLSSVASALDVLLSQINVEEVTEEEHQVVVRCIISAGSSHHFSASSAKALTSRLEGHTVQLPAVFGAYHLRSWKGLPLSKWSSLQSKKVKMVAIVSVLVGLVVLVAGSASLAYWYFSKYRHKDEVKYNNLTQDDTNEQENMIGDQQL